MFIFNYVAFSSPPCMSRGNLIEFFFSVEHFFWLIFELFSLHRVCMKVYFSSINSNESHGTNEK